MTTQCTLSASLLQSYREHLIREEKSAATLEKYLRDVRVFSDFAGDRPVSKEVTMAWKSRFRSKDMPSAPSIPCWPV